MRYEPSAPRYRLLLRGRLAMDSAGFHSLHHARGRLRMNATAARILSLCDGHRSGPQILECMRDQRSGCDGQDMVREFLDAALRSGWIVALPPAESAATPRVYLARSTGSAYT